MTDDKSLYDILDVSSTATSEEIKAAYHKRAKETHPDVVNDDGKEFGQVNNAYKILSDKDTRKFYDLTGKDSNKDVHELAIKLIMRLFSIVMESPETVVNTPQSLAKFLQKHITSMEDSNSVDIVKIDYQKKWLQKLYDNLEGINDNNQFIMDGVKFRLELLQNESYTVQLTRFAIKHAKEMIKDVRLNDNAKDSIQQQTLKWFDDNGI